MTLFRILVGALAVAFCLRVGLSILRGSENLVPALLVVLPVFGFGAYLGLLIFFGRKQDWDGGPPFWIGRPAGVGINLPNPAHPAGKLVYGAMTLAGLLWLALLDEWVRHDFSRLLYLLTHA